MSVQPIHSGEPLPRTIRAVRGALDADQRARFEAELSDTPIGEVDDLVLLWWGIAVMGNDPDVLADLRAAASGALHTHTSEDVFGDGSTGQ
ncbi:hypothetical protein [Embleya sp. AB8]|uniref:hypothetical protein n=1 Tax=Embleya sp. AB8 TaxID=3156304 RepID=UPI003C720154